MRKTALLSTGAQVINVLTMVSALTRVSDHGDDQSQTQVSANHNFNQKLTTKSL